MNIRSLVNGRADLVINKHVLRTLLHTRNSEKTHLSTNAFITLSFVLTTKNVQMLLESPRDLDGLLEALEESLGYGMTIKPGLRIIETLISSQAQVPRSISAQLFPPLVKLSRYYPFDIDGSIIERILKIVRDILSHSSAICVTTFFSNKEFLSCLEYLKMNLLELKIRNILDEFLVLAQMQPSKPSNTHRLPIRKLDKIMKATLNQSCGSPSASSSVIPIQDKRPDNSGPDRSTPEPSKSAASRMDNPKMRLNPPKSTLTITAEPVPVLRDFQLQTPEPFPEEVTNKPEEIIIHQAKSKDNNENEVLEDAVRFSHQQYLPGDCDTDAVRADEASKPVTEARRGLLDWMIDSDSDSATEEDTTCTDSTEPIAQGGELEKHVSSNETSVEDLDMEKLNQWNEDDALAKTKPKTSEPVDEKFSVKNNVKIPACAQLIKNQLLSVKPSARDELCEAERFFDIDVGFLTTQICGMLNTEAGGSIYLGVKQNRIIKGVRLDRKQKDKVLFNCVGSTLLLIS